MANARTQQTPQQQLTGFLAKYTTEIARESRQALRTLRRLLPGAIELVYDNYNALVIGFGPSPKPSEAILSIAVMPRYLNLGFIQHAARFPDPAGLLLGSGRMCRHIVLESAEDLEKPEVRKLIAESVRRGKVQIDPKQKRRLIIRSISAKQRPRRPVNK